ncbi:MAG: phosphopantothenate--cysteine ligase [Clostridiales Family XIII bacterium]|jgi:phosphopantothenate-cysteine ligase|nr:phosphopantothenate--cysteine ligase [Clostridiales Family XIII bacterium]
MNIRNILITAGGNTEKIDAVRMIRNTGTGRLGALIAEKLLARVADARVFYICDRHAVAPRDGGATVIHADDVTALEAAVRKVCAENRIDAVIHSMAVSDYRVKNVTTAANAADAASGASGASVASAASAADAASGARAAKPLPNEALAERIAHAKDVREGGKISSDLDDVLVVLERAPKVISLYRGLAPDAVIVGFKLLADVGEDELIDVGYKLLKKNDCDYVLANDTRYLSRGGHVGHLIARDGSYATYDGKDAIAGAIAAAVGGGMVI